MWLADEELRRETLEEAKQAASEAKEQARAAITVDGDGDDEDNFIVENYDSDSDYVKKSIKTWTRRPHYWRELVEYSETYGYVTMIRIQCIDGLVIM